MGKWRGLQRNNPLSGWSAETYSEAVSSPPAKGVIAQKLFGCVWLSRQVGIHGDARSHRCRDDCLADVAAL